MNTISVVAEMLSHSLAWALLFSLWQGAIIYGLLFMLAKALPGISSRVKYYLSMSAFAGLFVWFADTWASQYSQIKADMAYLPAMTGSGMEKTLSAHTVATAGGPALHTLASVLEQNCSIIMLLYTAGLGLMLGRLMLNVWQVRQLRTEGELLPDAAWNEAIAKWRKKLNISRAVTLKVSARINVPMMLGALKPIILMPMATINNLTTDEVEAILLHELAHIKRHDYLLNMLQTIGETILFFNPFVWLISAVVRKDRELCCDDIVVANTASPLSYARALTMIAAGSNEQAEMAMAATGSKNQLFHRIKRIMEMKKSNINYSRLTIAVAAILAITFTIAVFSFTPSFAQKAKKSGTPDTTRKSVYKYRTVTIDGNGNKTEEEEVSDKPIEQTHGKKEVTLSYDDGDTTGGKKIKKKVVIINKEDGDDEEGMNDETYTAVEKAMEDVDKEMKNIDWAAISKEMDKSLQEVQKSLQEVNKELQNSKMNKKINIEVKKRLEQSKSAMEDAQRHMKEQHKTMKTEVRIQNGGAGAYAYANTGEDSDHDYEGMLEQMSKDGLIDLKGSYTVQKENNELYINEKKQPADILEKYKSYLNSKSVTVKGYKGNLKITVKD